MIRVHYRGFTLTWWGVPTGDLWLCDRHLSWSASFYGSLFPHWATLADAVKEIDYYSPS